LLWHNAPLVLELYWLPYIRCQIVGVQLLP
jgi:hypothetical protein